MKGKRENHREGQSWSGRWRKRGMVGDGDDDGDEGVAWRS